MTEDILVFMKNIIHDCDELGLASSQVLGDLSRRLEVVALDLGLGDAREKQTEKKGKGL